MKFILLTLVPAKTPIYLNVTAICGVLPATKGKGSMIVTSLGPKAPFCVEEEPKEVVAKAMEP